MNISSAIVKTKPKAESFIIEQLKDIAGCDVHLHEGERIIITIEATDVSEEIAVIKEIEKTEGVLSVEMVYAYSEEELDRERDKVEVADDTPDWLNNDSLDAKQIRYGGNLRKRI